MNKPIILVGFMGSGKSTVARKLSFMKKMPLIDTDDYLESKEEKSISDMFVLFGETHFRELETRYLKDILDIVISCFRNKLRLYHFQNQSMIDIKEQIFHFQKLLLF